MCIKCPVNHELENLLPPPFVAGVLKAGQFKAGDTISFKEEIRTANPITGGEKGVKPARYGLIPTYPLEQLARLYGYGAKKYADRNWERGYEWSKSYDALQRHVNAFWSGEDIDPESGLPHLASAVFHCFALMEWGKTHPELDDRPKRKE